MELNYFGLKLSTLTKDDIQLVRCWRNSEFVRTTMQYQEHITPEQQDDWFVSIRNDIDYYFIIRKDEEKIGLVNIKDIDATKGMGEVGVFFGDESCTGFGLGVAVMDILYDFSFNVLKLNYVIATVLNTNDRAMSFNKSFGYEIMEQKKNVTVLTLTSQAYGKRRARIVKAIG